METAIRKLKRIAFASLLIFVIASCVTINIYFPAAAVEKVADEIVDEVWGAIDEGVDGADDTGEKGSTEEPQSFLDDLARYATITIGVNEAHAEEADIKVSTPAIRALKRSIQQRAGSIMPYLDKGNAGISNDGLLVSRSSKGLKLKARANLKGLLKAENRDREALYSEIAKANKFGPDKVEDIKRLFARSWIKNARAGWWVQNEDGTWRRK
ncbi:MAG: DUF1318 domain-containing protein [Thermodesulfobacteriota bacterium]